MKHITLIVAMGACLAFGLFTAFALAEKPPAPPGQDPCSHGRTGKPCREDPQPNHGKDCDHHGKRGGVNEDHCRGETTTTTETTTTETTTTTQATTTTQETTTSPPTTSTTQETTTSPSTTTTSTTTASPPSVVPPAVVTKKNLNNDLNKQAKKTNPGNVHTTHPQAAGELPNTGLPLGAVVALGLALMGAGLYLRRTQ